MRIRIPKFSWIEVVDDNGQLLRQECTQEDMLVFIEEDNVQKSDSEIRPTYSTMRHNGGLRP